MSGGSLFRRGREAVVERIAALLAREAEARARTSPALEVALRSMYAQYRRSALAGEPLPSAAEAGFRVPYDAHLGSQPGATPEYLGASPVAMTKLARRLGYRLAGANRFGFNLFYVREDVAPSALAPVELEALLRHDRVRERERLFDAIAHLPFVEV